MARPWAIVESKELNGFRSHTRVGLFDDMAFFNGAIHAIQDDLVYANGV
jgi:hypothetical protein